MVDTPAARIRLAALAAGLVLAGCGSTAEEPAGFATTPSTESSPEQAPTATSESATPEPTDAAEPETTFVQPFLDGEPSVVTLRREVPMDPLPDATAEQVDVVEAAGRFMASWEAILFGAGVEAASVEDTATGAQLDSLVNVAAEFEENEQVFVGQSMVLDLRAVDVSGDSAVVELCIELTGWVLVTRGGPPEIQPPLERYELTMERADGQWRASRSSQQDPAGCSDAAR